MVYIYEDMIQFLEGNIKAYRALINLNYKTPTPDFAWWNILAYRRENKRVDQMFEDSKRYEQRLVWFERHLALQKYQRSIDTSLLGITHDAFLIAEFAKHLVE